MIPPNKIFLQSSFSINVHGFKIIGEGNGILTGFEFVKCEKDGLIVENLTSCSFNQTPSFVRSPCVKVEKGEIEGIFVPFSSIHTV